MIIGITGYAGSGKDTAATLLKYLLKGDKPKDAAYRYVENYVTDSWLVKIKRFATPVKAIAAYLLDVSVLQFEDRDFKEQHIDWLGMSVRELLQKIGTECFREGLDPDVWVKYMKLKYEKEMEYKIKVHPRNTLEDLYAHESCRKCNFPYTGYKYQPLCSECAEVFEPIWIVPDMRFENELKLIKELNGVSIKIRRGQKTMNHPSENEIDNLTTDFVILNQGSIEDLSNKLYPVYEYISELL